jgi:hypothetical protein
MEALEKLLKWLLESPEEVLQLDPYEIVLNSFVKRSPGTKYRNC